MAESARAQKTASRAWSSGWLEVEGPDFRPSGRPPGTRCLRRPADVNRNVTAAEAKPEKRTGTANADSSRPRSGRGIRKRWPTPKDCFEIIRQAYRRPARMRPEVEALPALCRTALKPGKQLHRRHDRRLHGRAVLPEFSPREKPGRLDDDALASRLAFFLWTRLQTRNWTPGRKEPTASTRRVARADGAVAGRPPIGSSNIESKCSGNYNADLSEITRIFATTAPDGNL